MPEWKVPGYTELRAIGSGGFGDVMLARHDATRVLVAIKYLRPDLLADPGFAEMFRSEAEVLASMDDPNIVRLYEYVESASGAAIVMELIDGVSLREILAHQGSTTPEAALVVLHGSLLGLAAAHRRQVVHRDYKPENVLVNGDGASKLTDFGLAARTGDHPIPAGTLRYVAPEQIAGAAASPAGDVYAATATFYECLTGDAPFSGESAELLRQHRSQPVPLDPVPIPLRMLVAAGMAKDPQHRPADATALVTQLKAAASGAYGQDWEDHGRSHLGEAALLLAALWPASAPPAAQSTTVQRISLLRHLSPVKAAIAVGVAAAVVAGGTAVAAYATHRPGPPHRPVTVQPVPIQPTTATPTTIRSTPATAQTSPVPTPTSQAGHPGSPAPAAPSNLTATAADPNDIELSWQVNSSDQTGFEISNGVTSTDVGAGSTSYTWGGLSPGTYMCFKILAYNSAGDSAWDPD
ncbi:MAG TPA: protein kinase, partial [Streptosporangiaceae bacterium]|nr:protein kinase [Streptosporangiaceae bacterium]